MAELAVEWNRIARAERFRQNVGILDKGRGRSVVAERHRLEMPPSAGWQVRRPELSNVAWSRGDLCQRAGGCHRGIRSPKARSGPRAVPPRTEPGDCSLHGVFAESKNAVGTIPLELRDNFSDSRICCRMRSISVTSSLTLAFRVEMSQMLGLLLYYIMALVGLIAGLPGGVCGVLVDAEHRWMWALSLLAFLAFAGWIVYILRRGAEPLRMMQGMSKAFAGIGTLVAGILIFYGLQSPTLASVLWALFGVLSFLLTNFINLWNRMITAERTVCEHILHIASRLADLNRPPR